MARKLCLAVLILASLSSPGWGQQPVCIALDEIESVMQRAGEAFSEEMVVEGRERKRLMIFSNQETGSWTLFMVEASRPDRACIVSWGSEFTRYPSRPGRPS
jgi:hypothetical protein